MKIKEILILSMVLLVSFVTVNVLGQENSSEHNSRKAKMFFKNVSDEFDISYANSVSRGGSDETAFVKLILGGYKSMFKMKDLTALTAKPIISRKWDDFRSYANRGNAVKCYELIEISNQDRKSQLIDVFIYGKNVQDVSHCELFKQAYAEQIKKQNEEKLVEVWFG